jgi:excisionase family DNA binding protein
MQNEYLSVIEAAKVVGLGVSTLNKLRLTGGGPEYLKLGRRVLYPRDGIEAWLRSHRVGSTSDAAKAWPRYASKSKLGAKAA